MPPVDAPRARARARRAAPAGRRATVGYTAGAFDMLDAGDVALLRLARERCDHLVVGVATDELVRRVAGRAATIPMRDRVELVASLRHVDAVVPDDGLDPSAVLRWLGPDLAFVGSDASDADRCAWTEALQGTATELVVLPAVAIERTWSTR